MKNECVKTPPVDDIEKRALKALWAGEATEYQQRLALKVIVNKLCRADDLLYIPNSFDETAFMQGRGFVGLQLLKIIKQPLKKLEDSSNDIE